MQINCPLCQTEISTLKTKTGKSYANCHNCHMRMFVNSDLGENLLEQMSLGEKNSATQPGDQSARPTLRSEESSSMGIANPEGQLANTIAEVHNMRRRLDALETQSKASAKAKPKRKTGQGRRAIPLAFSRRRRSVKVPASTLF